MVSAPEGDSENGIPMRPRPIKPHVAHCDGVEEKLLRTVEGMELVRPPFTSVHSFDGENRMEIAAFIVAMRGMGCDKGGVGEAEGGRGREHATPKGNSRRN